MSDSSTPTASGRRAAQPSGNGHGPMATAAPRSDLLVWLALLTIYIVWGSTYIAIRVVVRTMPPMLSASARFLVAGALLYAFAVRRGDRTGDRPTLVQWKSAFIVGAALLLGGNGAVVWAEQTVPSGIASLIIATVPLWLVVLARLFLSERVTWREVFGIGVGFAGVALLFLGPGAQGSIDPWGAGALVFASVSWAAGSLYARGAQLPARPLVGTAMQMIGGGVCLAVAGVVLGELRGLDVAAFSTESILGLVYLVVFGSWLGFTAYAWLIRVARTSLVGTYAYVNPVVAVFLGWLLLREPITVKTLVAGAVILVGVALIVSARSRTASRSARVAPGEPAEGVPTEELHDGGGEPRTGDAAARGPQGIARSKV